MLQKAEKEPTSYNDKLRSMESRNKEATSGCLLVVMLLSNHWINNMLMTLIRQERA